MKRSGSTQPRSPKVPAFDLASNLLAVFPKALHKEFNDFTNHLIRLHTTPPPWVASVTRAMMLAGCKLDPVVEMAIRRYREALDDLSRYAKLSRQLHRTHAQDLVARGKRHLADRKQVLEELGVQICPVHVGDVFNPHEHDPQNRIPARTAKQIDTIASSEGPVFRWMNEYGQEQITPAPVTVYTTPTTNGNGRSSR